MINHHRRSIWLMLMLLLSLDAIADGQDNSPDANSPIPQQLPWDFDPYRVMIWIAGVEPSVVNEGLGDAVKAYLDRDFR
jgi:hypothetical protein